MSMTAAPAAGCPAIIFHVEGGRREVAGMSLLDRIMVTLHRAGAGPISVISVAPLPRLNRTTTLNIPFKTNSATPVFEERTLVVRSDLLVQASDVRELLRQEGRLATASGETLAIGVVDGVDASWETALRARPLVRARGVALSVTDESSRAAAEKLLWSSLSGPADGLVDRFLNRPVGRVFSRALAHTGVSPNAVSLVSILIGLAAAGCFGMGGYAAMLAGALLFQFSAVVDCVDGELARVLFKESRLGKWLDLAGDQVVHTGVFVGITIGLLRQGYTPALWLGLSAVLGAVFSFLVVLRSLRQPAGARGGLLERLIHSLTNRDFSLLVLALAGIHRLEWFLWLAAIGSHLFWIVAATLQRAAASSPERANP